MGTLILSGVGGSTNWLPLILPLAVVAGLIYFVDFIVKLAKKRKLDHVNRLLNEHSTAFGDQDTTDNQL